MPPAWFPSLHTRGSSHVRLLRTLCHYSPVKCPFELSCMVEPGALIVWGIREDVQSETPMVEVVGWYAEEVQMGDDYPR